MNTTTLPAPPADDTAWTVTTLAQLLCIDTDTVHQHLTAGDKVKTRNSHGYRAWANGHNAHHVDAYLTTEAAERIAADHPVGLLARRVHSVDDVAFLGPDQILAIARQYVAQFGGAS